MKTSRLLFILMMISFIIITSCDENPTENATVRGVEVTPSVAFVSTGQTKQFTATVHGVNNPPTTVLWLVTGENSNETTIDNTGLLSVASDETALELVVTATSVYDPTKSDFASVTITDRVPTVERVEVTPDYAEVLKGTTFQFNAEVIGEYDPPQTVLWTVTGGVSGTSIHMTTGLLTVSANEPTFKVLTVRANSAMDATVYGTATVLVVAEDMDSYDMWVYLQHYEAESTDGELILIPYVSVSIERDSPYATEPPMTVRVNGTTCQYDEVDFWEDDDGVYHYTGYFIYTTPFVGGSTYSVYVNIDGVSATGNVVMPYTPNVIHPPSFNHEQPMSFAWTLGNSATGNSAMIQQLYIEYETVDWGWGDIADGMINASTRAYIIPANTVPSNWSYLYFDLGELNAVFSGNTAFVAVAYYETLFASGANDAVRRGGTSRDSKRDMWRVVRGQK